MSKQRRYHKNQQPEVQQPEPEVEILQEEPSASKKNWMPYIITFLLGFALYANTIPFDYTLDDKLYITANEFTKKGIDGIHDIWTNDLMTGFFGSKKNLVEGGRYRPLSQTTHAIEWQIFGNNPEISHLINVVLYGLIGMLLLSVLKRIFSWKEDRWWWSIPFVATALFLAHPTHTEVGASIKSRDEILSVLFALMAFRSVLVYMKNGHFLHVILAGFWFFSSILSKESSATFIGVIPLTLIFFPQGSFKRSALSMTGMVAFVGLYLMIRTSVYSDHGDSMLVANELMNKPYILATESERLASIFFTMGLYVKLLFFPHPLTHDYYPFHPFATFAELQAGGSQYLDWNDTGAMASLILYAALSLFGLITLVQKLMGKPANIYGYGVLLYLGTFILYSNLFFDIGAFMNERFLFIPSIGFVIIVAHFLVNFLSKKMAQNVAVGLFGIIMIGYAGKTFFRNYAWENDRALASADVGTSDGSAKVKMTYGSELLEQAKEKGVSEIERTRLLNAAEESCLNSLRIYPQYFPPLDILGNIYFEKKNYDLSVKYFNQALRYKPNDARIRSNTEAVGNMAMQKGAPDAAIEAFKALAKVYKGKDLSRVYSNMGEVYGKNKNDLQNSMKYLQLAQQADQQNSAVYQKIGIVYAMSGQADSALTNFNKALQLDPENARVMLNLGVLYGQLGQIDSANQYMTRAKELDPTVTNQGQ
ncbi:MAG: tetratricopeptide repeat protein [Salibacteraceae bacterium]|nr:tetratricopeptide repeat protein [Salibacteraceae bacterium]